MYRSVQYNFKDKRHTFDMAVQIAAQSAVNRLNLLTDWQELADKYHNWYKLKEARAYARFRLSKMDCHKGLE